MNAPGTIDAVSQGMGRSRFSRPGDVVDAQRLPLEEKRNILLRWLEDERALLAADDDGMPGERPSQLGQVVSALRDLPC
jgi:hypothetical protein